MPTSAPANPHKKPGRWKKWVVGLVALIVIVLIVRFLWPSGAKPAVDMSIPVVTVKATVGEMDVNLRALGTITPPNNITVRTQVTGRLMTMPFKEGQMVKAGDVLAQIDPRPYEAALLQAEGQLTRDEALLANAKLDLTRYQTLWEKNSVAKQTLDTQEALVKQNEGTVRLDNGLVNAARVNLAYTKITAPVSGRVGLRQVDPGNIVQIGDANGLVVLTQVQPITVFFSLPQDTLGQVLTARDKGEVVVEAWDPSDQKNLAIGTLESIDNQIDPTTGTYKLRARFDNKDNKLFPNQFVNIRLRAEVLKDVILLPNSAIQQGSIGAYVYVVKPDHKVTLRKVTLGPASLTKVVIAQGIQSGETVVIDGVDNLKEGSSVKEVSPAGTPTATPPKASSHKSSKGGV